MTPDQLPTKAGEKKNILVAEDEPVVRGFIRSVLYDHRYVILEAVDGEQAVQMARDWIGPLHLLITDFYLSKLSGHDLAQRLFAQRRETKVLFLAGYGEEVIVGQDLIGPKSAFLQKPFGRPDLINQVQALLEGKESAWRVFKPSLTAVLERIVQSSSSAFKE